MRRRTLSFVAAFGFVAGLSALSLAAPPAKVTIKHAAAKHNVELDHAAHVKLAKNCATCHHTSKADGSDIQKGGCAVCHGKTEDAPKLQKAFHGGKNKAGGTSCKGCHATHKDKMNKCATPEPIDKCSTCHKSKCK